MGFCLSTACGCPEETLMLAWMAIFFIYFIFAFLFYKLSLTIFENEADEEIFILLGIFFPVTITIGIIVGLGYVLYKIVTFPFIVATKEDLRILECSLKNKIEDQCSNRRKSSKN